ncbi:MAG: cupredoxin family copper-binding protein [Streptomyces sp.]|uniref:cupredoxin domain-containing protein n=1 Tax=Streptomyces sp. TaxID=1931 RepID=UPI0025F8D662|nr:cupredoxin family copper-binding protein [Streptomyces sp.]MBW8798077.1 cupredoxin family copper-binding protein [Streptomyces sp.]
MPRLTALTARNALRAVLTGLLLTAAGVVLPAAMARATTTHQIVMSGYAFSPRSLTVTAGDTVTWVNRDQAPHNVKTVSGPASFQSSMLNRGGVFSHTFSAPGTYDYECTVHPGMTAVLVVKAAAPATPAPSSHPTAHQHAASAPAALHTTEPRSTAPAAPAAHADRSGKAAAPGTDDRPSPSPSPTAIGTPTTVDTRTTAATARPLDPLLILTGVVAGVAVLCLLLVGSRSAALPRRDESDPTSAA